MKKIKNDFGMSKGERKAKGELRARSDPSKTLTYLSCPLCFWQKYVKEGKEGIVKFDRFNEDNYFMQIRLASGGDSAGFPIDKSQSLTLLEAKESEDPQMQEWLAEIKAQCRKILEMLE